MTHNNSARKLTLILFTMGLGAGCRTTENHVKKTITVQDSTINCIDKGSDPAGGLIEKCRLETWADLPNLIENSEHLVIKFPDTDFLTIPCESNTTWIGYIGDGLIAKCRKRTNIRLYWRLKKSESEPSYTYTACCKKSAIVYHGQNSAEYIIIGRPGRPSTFFLDNLVNQKYVSESELIIEGALQEK